MSKVLARAYAATGMLGSGFSESSLETALSWRPDFIGVDSGSTDGGPNYLATGSSMFGEASIARDLALLLQAARDAGIPLIIGSAGTGGGDRNLAWAREILLRVANDLGLRFELATIRAEQDPGALKRAWRDGRVAALQAAPNVGPDDVDSFSTIVAMMGTEPIARALDMGADVVLAGRASDAAIFATIPLRNGVDPGIAWHAAKVLECGAAAVTHRTHPDGMFVELERDAFTIFPPKPEFRCTPQSIAAHALYENADPFALTEPSGTVRLDASRYEVVDDRTVRVSGTTFHEAASYTVKLEAARLRGYRSLFLGAVRDPYVLRQLGDWLDQVEATARRRAAASFPDADFELVIRRYGHDGVVRVNTEGFYADRNVLNGSSEMVVTPDVTVSLRVVTRQASERVAEHAFALAERRAATHGRPALVTALHKANVLRRTDGLFLEACRTAAERHPSVTLDDMHADAFCLHALRDPSQFDVVVTTNLFGDLVSDLTAGLVGGLGLAPGLNVGREHAMAQATHGSAPDIAGKGIANPTAEILSGAMLIEWLSGRHGDAALARAAALVTTSVERALATTDTCTPDLGGSGTTESFTAAVIDDIGRQANGGRP